MHSDSYHWNKSGGSPLFPCSSDNSKVLIFSFIFVIIVITTERVNIPSGDRESNKNLTEVMFLTLPKTRESGFGCIFCWGPKRKIKTNIYSCIQPSFKGKYINRTCINGYIYTGKMLQGALKILYIP